MNNKIIIKIPSQTSTLSHISVEFLQMVLFGNTCPRLILQHAPETHEFISIYYKGRKEKVEKELYFGKKKKNKLGQVSETGIQ